MTIDASVFDHAIRKAESRLELFEDSLRFATGDRKQQLLEGVCLCHELKVLALRCQYLQEQGELLTSRRMAGETVHFEHTEFFLTEPQNLIPLIERVSAAVDEVSST